MFLIGLHVLGNKEISICSVATSQKRKCRYKKSIVEATCKGFVGVRPRTELALKEAVARIGPIAVSIYANLSSFKHFKGGTRE